MQTLLLVVLGATLLVTPIAPGSNSAAAAPVSGLASAGDVSGDDSADRYVGTGGLVLPGSVDSHTRRVVAECSDCQWRLAKPCAAVSWGGCTFDPRFCREGSEILRTWFSEDHGASWRNMGLVCIGPGGPVTVASVGAAVIGGFERMLPPSQIRYQPNRGVLPYLPVVFHSGQPQSIPATEYVVAGERVHLDPIAHWQWEFGDGSSLATDSAGSVYPDESISHTYRWQGEFRVVVTTTWSATYYIDDLGPFEVVNPVYQSDSALVRVGQARALLTR